jgi:hypothetical protein
MIGSGGEPANCRDVRADVGEFRHSRPARAGWFEQILVTRAEFRQVRGDKRDAADRSG